MSFLILFFNAFLWDGRKKSQIIMYIREAEVGDAGVCRLKKA